MIRDFLAKRSVALLQDPRMQKVMQDPRVMKGMMQAIQMRGQLQDKVDTRVDKLAQSLNLATKKDMREMKRALRKMEQELKRTKAAAAKAEEMRIAKTETVAKTNA